LERVGFSVRELKIFGEIWEQQGENSLRKKIEFSAAKIINQVGKTLNKGMYMDIWAQKREV
jgi:hypothetical protein